MRLSWMVTVLVAAALAGAQTVAPAPAHWWDEAKSQPIGAPAPLFATPPTIDGDLAEWADLPALPLGLPFQTGFAREWNGRGDLSASVWLGWDRSGWYVAAHVADDRVILAPNDRTKGEHLQLFLGGAEQPAEECRAVFILPPKRQGEGAQVLDGDSGEALAGAVAAWAPVDRGYRVEARIPWAHLPGGVPNPGELSALALRVFDWEGDRQPCKMLSFPAPIDANGAPRPARRRRPRPQPAAENQNEDNWVAPRREAAERPTHLAQVTWLADAAEARAERFLAALFPLSAERGGYGEDEPVRVLGLVGCSPAQAERVELYVAEPDAPPVPLSREEPWSEGAVRGVRWVWRTPLSFRQPLLLVGSLGEGPGARTYARLQTLSVAADAYIERFKKLREQLQAKAVEPGSDARRRRYLGAIIINLEERQRQLESWRHWIAREDIDRAEKDLAEVDAQVADALAGADPLAGRRGQLLRGYVAELDDTLQHYAVYVPETWSPTARLPLLVTLHGYGFGQFMGSPARVDERMVVVSPYGRGNGDYKLWCEEDIRAVIAGMLEDYGCDPDRVYCTGESMGGTGSWQMATAYPDLFAAIAPTMGNTNQRVWEEQWGWGQQGLTALTPFRNWLQDATSAYHYAENLRHVPASVAHGTNDDIVPVGHSRTMVQRLRALGYEVIYDEQDGVGHGGFAFGTEARQRTFLLTKVRDPWPKRVTYRTSWPRYDGAYWLRIERLREPGRDGWVDARVEGQTITIEQFGTQRLALTLGPKLVDTTQPVRVVVNHWTAYEGAVPQGGVLRLGTALAAWGPVGTPQGLEKNAAVGGPIEHAYMTRFLLVVGTSGDRRANEANRRMADQFADKWKRWGRGQRARVKLDWEVTPRDIAESNLICYGAPDSNRLVAQVNDRLPIRFDNGAVVAGNEVFRGDDVGVKLCYPNPLNPQRYVCVFAGASWQGTWDIDGRFGNFFDWGVYDDRNWYDFAVFDARTASPETYLLVGYFDADWKLDNALSFRGDPELRAKVVPRRAPDPVGGLPTGQTVWVSELAPKHVRMEKGAMGYDQSMAGRPITLGRMAFDRGLGVHPEAELVYELDGSFDTFEAWVGVDLEGASGVSAAREQAERVSFEVVGDGRMLAESGEMRWNTPPRRLVARVGGVRELKLIARARDFRKWLFGDAGWGLARLIRPPSGADAPRPEPGPTERLALEGAWHLEDYPVGSGVANGAAEAGAELPERRITVPGAIPAALAAVGEIPDPYRNDQLGAADALAQREWWLYRPFELPYAWAGRRIVLRLSGVTQYGDVWLNGRPLGRVQTPLALTELDATAAARYGSRNLLAVRLTAGPVEWTTTERLNIPGRDRAVGYPVAWGGDGGGRCLPLGINGVCDLRATGDVGLEPPRVTTTLPPLQVAGSEARVAARVSVDVVVANRTPETTTCTLRATIVSPEPNEPPCELAATVTLDPGERKPVTLSGELEHARLWWPAGHGARPLYRLALRVEHRGQLSDTRQTTFGVREVRLTSSGVQVNGRPLALRLARWRPVDRLLRRSTGATERGLRHALHLGLNALLLEAGALHASPELAARCDALGLLLLGELPLTGSLGGLAPEVVTAAAEGLATELQNHPSRLGYLLGVDVEPGGEERLAQAAARVMLTDPSALLVDPVSSAAGRVPWSWSQTAATGRVGAVLGTQQVVLPGAGPAEVDFLDAEKLPDSEVLLPWPLTAWWGVRGGSERDLAQAEAWLGPAGEEEPLERRLTAWQAESARRQLAQCPPGATVYLGTFNESWPRVGEALVDFGGRLRPAADVVRRLLRLPGVCATGPETVAPGEALTIEVRAPDLVADQAPAGAELRCRLHGPDGKVWREGVWPLPPEATSEPIGKLVWEVPPGAPVGVYTAVTEVLGLPVEPDALLVGVRGEAGPTPVTVRWFAAGQPPAGCKAATDTAAVVYAGPGGAYADADAAAKAVEGGAGLVLDGPPDWLIGSPLDALLPVRAGLTDSYNQPPVVARPEVVAPEHPALAGLKGSLPPGPADSAADAVPGATVLIRHANGRPLLVEGPNRLLLLRATSAYRRRLAAWDGWPRFLSGLLAYAGKLPWPETRRLLAQPDEQPFRALPKLPLANVVLDLPNGPLAAVPGQPAVRTFKVRNDSPHLVPQAMLALAGASADAWVSLNCAVFALRPGETREVTLTVETWRRVRRNGTLRVKLDGWGVKPAQVDLPLELGH